MSAIFGWERRCLAQIEGLEGGMGSKAWVQSPGAWGRGGQLLLLPAGPRPPYQKYVNQTAKSELGDPYPYPPARPAMPGLQSLFLGVLPVPVHDPRCPGRGDREQGYG